MKKTLLALTITGLYLFPQGCGSVPIFPNNASQEVNKEQFGVLVAKPDVYRGQAVKLAGRVVGVKTTEKGTMILAEWLPLPEEGQYGPGSNQIAQQDRFSFLYPGAIDSWGTWKGNRFIVTGEIEGTHEVISSLTGHSKSLPYMVARCIHVWEIGDNLWWDQPDTDPGGYPYLQKTYCANPGTNIS